MGPERLATIEMVDDQQNVELICFPLMGWESLFTGFDPGSFLSLASPSYSWAIERREKSVVRSVDPMAIHTHPDHIYLYSLQQGGMPF